MSSSKKAKVKELSEIMYEENDFNSPKYCVASGIIIHTLGENRPRNIFNSFINSVGNC